MRPTVVYAITEFKKIEKKEAIEEKESNKTENSTAGEDSEPEEVQESESTFKFPGVVISEEEVESWQAEK